MTSELAKIQPCGCVVCTCENDDQCQGCGAKNCGNHPVGQIPNPVYLPTASLAEPGEAETPGFTRGPWTLTHRSGSNFAVQEFEIRGMFMDSPNVNPIFNKSCAAIDGTTIFVCPEDALLLTAAPDLYAACQAVLETWEGRDLAEVVDIVRAAIKKARGPR
jgi:hypothetical protein